MVHGHYINLLPFSAVAEKVKSKDPIQGINH